MGILAKVWLYGVCTALIGCYVFLFISGTFSLFVHPRLHWLTYVFITGLAILILYGVLGMDMKDEKIVHSLFWAEALFFLVVAIMLAGRSTLHPASVLVADMATVFVSKNQSSTTTDIVRDDEGILQMTADSYYKTIVTIYGHTKKYLWERLASRGIVFKGEGDRVDEFGVGMYYMTCCAADAQLVWLKYRMVSGDPPPVWERVEVVWTIDETQDGEPVILVEKIDSIDPIKNPYIYF